MTAFDNARDAKASFAQRVKDSKAAEKCPSVGFVPPGRTVPTMSTIVQHQKFAAIGDGSFAERGTATSGGEPGISLTFLSGADVVQITIFDGLTPAAIPPSLRNLATTAKRAQQQLPHLISIPAPAPARALVVDPATSGCAQQGLKSPRSSTAATITFVNKTDQTLLITWFDLTGATRGYGDVGPKSTHDQQTYVGHIWKLSDQTGQCVRIATVTGPKTKVTVTS